MKAKAEMSPADFGHFLNSGPTVLAVAPGPGRPNIITLSWAAPVSHEPPMMVIAVAPRRFSHDLILASGEVTVNVPPWSLLAEAAFCGRVSGRDVDKFAECAFTPLPSTRVAPPGIAECLATFECRVENHWTAGDHTLFLLHILRLAVDEEVAGEGFDPSRPRPSTIHHLGGDFYAPLGEPVRERGALK